MNVDMAKATLKETEELIERLQDAAEYMAQFEMYSEKLDEAGLSPSEIDSIEMFRQIPSMTSEDLAKDFEKNPPFGTLVPQDESITRVNFTPNPHMESRMPVISTNADIKRSKRPEIYRERGITEEDVVLNTASLTPFPFGWSIAAAVEEIGATHIPMGPGNTEEQVEVIQNFDVTVICGFPSFIQQIAETADEYLDDVELIVASGEPFTAIEGYRERVRDAYGGNPIVMDGYGLSEVGPVARETQAEDGMHVFTDLVFPEVIDPETGELLELGEKGELVLTHLTPTSVPVLRFRTHDLTVLDVHDGEYVLPEGVFGRTDRMQKIKGVKMYPDELLLSLAGVNGVDHKNVQFEIVRPKRTTHRLNITVAGDTDVISEATLANKIQSQIGISVDKLQIVEGFEVSRDEQIIESTTAT
jgi:phenylacetate-CoA ligase